MVVYVAASSSTVLWCIAKTRAWPLPRSTCSGGPRPVAPVVGAGQDAGVTVTPAWAPRAGCELPAAVDAGAAPALPPASATPESPMIAAPAATAISLAGIRVV